MATKLKHKKRSMRSYHSNREKLNYFSVISGRYADALAYAKYQRKMREV